MKHFYNDLINIEEIIIQIESLALEKTHRKDLYAILDSMIHNTILDFTLSKLTEDDKLEFLKMLQAELSSDTILRFLKSKISNFEQLLDFEYKELKIELLKDINESQNLSTKY